MGELGGRIIHMHRKEKRYQPACVPHQLYHGGISLKWKLSHPSCNFSSFLQQTLCLLFHKIFFFPFKEEKVLLSCGLMSSRGSPEVGWGSVCRWPGLLLRVGLQTPPCFYGAVRRRNCPARGNGARGSWPAAWPHLPSLTLSAASETGHCRGPGSPTPSLASSFCWVM